MSMTLLMAVRSQQDAESLGEDPDDDLLFEMLQTGESLDLGKMWDAVQSLFEGGSNPLFAGTSVTGDLGYGPATFVSPDETRRVAVELGGLVAADLESRFHPELLMARGAYPAIWDAPDEIAEAKSEVVALALAVGRLYAVAAARGDGLLIAMV